jgi:hypothetical protein
MATQKRKFIPLDEWHKQQAQIKRKESTLTLHCGNCGAVITWETKTCPTCDTELSENYACKIIG